MSSRRRFRIKLLVVLSVLALAMLASSPAQARCWITEIHVNFFSVCV